MCVLINCNYFALGPELSAQLKEERTEYEMDEKFSTPEATSTSSHGEKANTEPDDSLLHAVSAVENNRKPKTVPTGKLQTQPTNGSLRRKRKPKVSNIVLLIFFAISFRKFSYM